jgi:hypothetical protein
VQTCLGVMQSGEATSIVTQFPRVEPRDKQGDVQSRGVLALIYVLKVDACEIVVTL